MCIKFVPFVLTIVTKNSAIKFECYFLFSGVRLEIIFTIAGSKKTTDLLL